MQLLEQEKKEQGKPSTKSFGARTIWSSYQKTKDGIFCLRPPDKTGLPLIILDDVFRVFCLDIDSEPPLHTSESAHAASQLCSSMGRQLNEANRGKDLEECLKGLLGGGWGKQCNLDKKDSRKQECALEINGRVCLLWQAKSELSSDGDAYMQVSRAYQMLTEALLETDQGLLRLGAPTFLVCVVGKSIALGLRPVSSGELNSHH